MEEGSTTTGESRNPDGTFPPGVSGNPGGRPKGAVSITAAVRAALKEYPLGKDGKPLSKTHLEFIVSKILKKASVEGDQATLKMVWNYIDGLPKQTIKVGNDGDKPFRTAYKELSTEELENILKGAGDGEDGDGTEGASDEAVS